MILQAKEIEFKNWITQNDYGQEVISVQWIITQKLIDSEIIETHVW